MRGRETSPHFCTFLLGIKITSTDILVKLFVDIYRDTPVSRSHSHVYCRSDNGYFGIGSTTATTGCHITIQGNSHLIVLTRFDGLFGIVCCELNGIVEGVLFTVFVDLIARIVG